jgi:transcriptional regulator with XRE-family HTH domain
MAIGHALRKARNRRGLSIQELAAILDVNPSVVSRYENGHHIPSLISLKRLCQAMGVRPSKLLEDLGW